jgi:transcription antitermination factor NusG
VRVVNLETRPSEQPALGTAEYAAQLSGRWWVLHTRARHERAVALALAQQDIPHYLPLARHGRTYGKHRVHVELPLFPGYLFLCGGASECEAARRTRRVAAILRVCNEEQFRDELQQIHRVVESGIPVCVYPGLRIGRRCRVIAGSLMGLEGIVLKRRSGSRMYISATVLNQSAVVEIDCALLEPID